MTLRRSAVGECHVCGNVREDLCGKPNMCPFKQEAKRPDPWAQLERIAREINPDLPADLSGYELRITLNKDFQGVEIIDRRFADRMRARNGEFPSEEKS